MSESRGAGPAWLVLPTYNEAENLEPLVTAALENLPDSARVLVVDDNSPDGTGKLADRLAAGEARIEVLHRARKEGLGPADVAIGSRYVPGGGVENWSALRQGISRGGSAYARLVLGLPIRDLTGGFKCFRREVLEAIDLDAISARGYAFQVEMTYRAVQLGFRVAEVPITFRERRAGASKMSRSIVLEAAWRVPQLRMGRRG